MYSPRVGGEEGGSIVIFVSFVCSNGGRSDCALLVLTSIQQWSQQCSNSFWFHLNRQATQF